MDTIGSLWGLFRGMLNHNSFNTIKNIAGAIGIPIQELGHLSQSGPNPAAKGALLDGIDKLYKEFSPDEQDRVTVNLVEELWQSETQKNDIEKLLSRVGWGLSNNKPYPISLQLVV